MATLQIKWQASDQLLLAEIAQTGRGQAPERSITVDLTQVAPAQRQALLALTRVLRATRAGEPIIDSIDLSERPKPDSAEDLARGMRRTSPLHLDAEPTLDQAISLAQEIAAERAALQAEADRITAEKRTHQQAISEALARAEAEIDALAHARDLAGLLAWRAPAEIGIAWHRDGGLLIERRQQAIADIEEAERAVDRAHWIATHGSPFLQRCTEAGYNCQRQYVIERAALEAPTFTVDFDDRAAWKDRACPTPMALDLADEARELGLGEPLIVWLTRPASDMIAQEHWDDEAAFAPCEAVVLRGFLGKYDLVRLVCTEYA